MHACARSSAHVSGEVDGFPRATKILGFIHSLLIDRVCCNPFCSCVLGHDHTLGPLWCPPIQFGQHLLNAYCIPSTRLVHTNGSGPWLQEAGSLAERQTHPQIIIIQLSSTGIRFGVFQKFFSHFFQTVSWVTSTDGSFPPLFCPPSFYPGFSFRRSFLLFLWPDNLFKDSATIRSNTENLYVQR